MGFWSHKLDTNDGKTHHVYTRSDKTLDVTAADSIAKSWGTPEASRCDSLRDAISVVEAHTGSSVMGVRKI
jgi:hypothetical protein